MVTERVLKKISIFWKCFAKIYILKISPFLKHFNYKWNKRRTPPRTRKNSSSFIFLNEWPISIPIHPIIHQHTITIAVYKPVWLKAFEFKFQYFSRFVRCVIPVSSFALVSVKINETRRTQCSRSCRVRHTAERKSRFSLFPIFYSLNTSHTENTASSSSSSAQHQPTA